METDLVKERIDIKNSCTTSEEMIGSRDQSRDEQMNLPIVQCKHLIFVQWYLVPVVVITCRRIVRPLSLL
jgi:hypothetical protein